MSLSLGPDLSEVARAAVFGLAKSGKATVRALLERGVRVVGTDSAPAEALGTLPAGENLSLVLGGHPVSLIEGVDLCVVSPGVPMSIPALDAARASGIPVIAEIELASRLVPGLVVGITGTNGKSTTTALTAALLCDAGRDAVACGNFGTPWIEYALGATEGAAPPAPSRVWVVELSSFQLEGLRRFAPDVAVHLNLTPDHLDRYRSVDDYGAAKARIFESQGEAQIAVLNADDPLVSRVRTRARRLLFSRARAVEAGAWLKDDVFLADAAAKGPRVYARRGDLLLPGSHNVENALAALAATIPLGVTPESAVRTFRTFKGLRHRTALVRTRNGVAFYNDSKGTNVDATLKSLEGFADGSVFLILGGKDKGDDFRRLLPLAARKVRKILAIGKAGPAVMRALADGVACEEAGTIARAVEIGASEGRPGDVVLLSPACASFDQFRNFEHRGEAFEELVLALPEAGG
ncbi:MAG: UDP-N-acetylmuramoyl-L-alanine--D-glutamate ligase [Thermoanaerobaculia bacterium]